MPVKETSVPCNGNLSKDYSLSLKLDNYVKEDTNYVSIIVKLANTSKENLVDLSINKSNIKIFINDKFVKLVQLYLDFTKNPYYLVGYNYSIQNTDTKIITIKASLEVDNDSNYITNTEIQDSIALRKIYRSTPSINILAVQVTYCFIDVLAKTTSDFDLIEYKINTEDWKPYTDVFRVYKIPRKQFIQARIKQDRYLLLLKCY